MQKPLTQRLERSPSRISAISIKSRDSIRIMHLRIIHLIDFIDTVKVDYYTNSGSLSDLARRPLEIEAKNGLGEDRFCRIRSANSELLVKKPVKYGPSRSFCSRLLVSPTSS